MQVDNISEPEINEDNSEEFEAKIICNSKVYAKELEGHLLGLQYSVSLKAYLEEKNN